MLLAAAQTVAAPAMVPPADSGSTLTVSGAETAKEHTPLRITARKAVVVVRLVAERDVVVFAISVEVTQLLVERCHFTTEPT